MNHLNKLAEHLAEMGSRKEVIDFFKFLLTPSEQEEIPMRLEIVQMLKKGASYEEIRSKLGVSSGKISRMAQEIKRGGFDNISGKSGGKSEIKNKWLG